MKPKILCVDDSTTIRKVLHRLFQRFDCQVLEAENGEVAFTMATQDQPDLIILDYNMPVLDGLGMLRLLRADPVLKKTPVIMLTAESSPEIISAVARLGVRDYIIKPFREEQLLSKVGRIIVLSPLLNHPTQETSLQP